MKILCLSNGHGEDAIALRILRELQQQPHPPELAVFPLVGEGQAFAQLENAPVIGPVQRMPSGGFIYMDSRELLRDVKGGLLQLTIAQFKAIRAWVRSHNDSQNQNAVILAVGDIVPLLFAWLSGAPYVFVGTAKSDYYLRDENGPLASQSGGISLEAWSGSVYLPWERWLMTRKRCRAVFPRDALTTETLEKLGIRAYNLGNPMMDELEPENPAPGFYGGGGGFGERSRSLVITLLPGSRAPEAYANWQLIIEAVAVILSTFGDRKLLFLGAISPELNLEALRSILEYFGWNQEGTILTQHREGSILRPPVFDPQEMQKESPNFQLPLTFVNRKATMILSQQNFNDYLYEADLAVAMAGTATEQFVGLGKPAIAISGSGPQFTPAFAEAQSRLLGPSLILVNHPSEVASTIKQLLFREPDRLELIYENGKRRMGEPGAARRIANCLIDRFVNSF
ncbi:lipid-A-disaccharide synthase-related protein [Tychonema sp. BBK16]|uniref:lipid-A-disaccharide synthase-related protein n=1 Tax=Tychonema sp. BBK16 TaxID=2699888 RepID=UPI001F20FF3C|nr:lipid-A-disaccharide synthase-related protein [Tychonema sp. BBK16]MCF6373056.1 lipid-A-disaccharide synthase-related protein [Tychonema sp. BBK16]